METTRPIQGMFLKLSANFPRRGQEVDIHQSETRKTVLLESHVLLLSGAALSLPAAKPRLEVDPVHRDRPC